LNVAGPCTIGACRNAPLPCEATARRQRLQLARRAAIATPVRPLLVLATVSSYGSSGSSYRGGGSVEALRPGGGQDEPGRRSVPTPRRVASIEPVARKAAEQSVSHPERRDLFLCHAGTTARAARPNFAAAWSPAERRCGSARGCPLGTLLIREIDKDSGTRASGSCWSPGAAQEHRAGAHRGEGTLRSARHGPVIPVAHGRPSRPFGR